MILIGKNLSQCHFAHQKSQWTDLGLDLGLRSEKTQRFGSYHIVNTLCLGYSCTEKISFSVLRIIQNMSMHSVGRRYIVFMFNVMVRAVTTALYRCMGLHLTKFDLDIKLNYLFIIAVC